MAIHSGLAGGIDMNIVDIKTKLPPIHLSEVAENPARTLTWFDRILWDLFVFGFGKQR
jgi:hypothetical protein